MLEGVCVGGSLEVQLTKGPASSLCGKLNCMVLQYQEFWRIY